VILVCPETVRPDRATLDACHRANPHGAGVAWREEGKVRWFKGLEPDELEPLIADIPGEIVIHFRWASVGEVTPKLCHPFPATATATAHRTAVVRVAERQQAQLVLLADGRTHPLHQNRPGRAVPHRRC